jgi:hypothetical protein
LGRNDAAPGISELRDAVKPALLEPEGGGEDDWRQLLLKQAGGAEIALIERNLVLPGELGSEELEDFRKEVAELKPASGAAWLNRFLQTVKVIYAFQVLGGIRLDGSRDILQRLYAQVWNAADGILQSDGEGFSNEEGFTIVWQFSEDARGPWKVGLLGGDGKWTHFTVELSNPAHRAAFLRGEIPEGVMLL